MAYHILISITYDYILFSIKIKDQIKMVGLKFGQDYIRKIGKIDHLRLKRLVYKMMGVCRFCLLGNYPQRCLVSLLSLDSFITSLMGLLG